MKEVVLKSLTRTTKIIGVHVRKIVRPENQGAEVTKVHRVEERVGQ